MATVHREPAPESLTRTGSAEPRFWASLLPRRRTGRTFYDVLEVPPDASAEAINDSYRSLAARLHAASEPDLRSRRQEVEGAWAVLSNPERRQRYDTRLQRQATPTNGRIADLSHDHRSVDPLRLASTDFRGLRHTSAGPEILDSLKVVDGSIEFRPVSERTSHARLRQKLLALLPAEEIRLDAQRQLWTVPAYRMPALRKVFLNVDALLEQAHCDGVGLEIPDYTVPHAQHLVRARVPRPQFRIPEYVAPTGQQPFNMIIVVALALMTAWNLYVAADNRRAAAAEATVQAPVPVITPVPMVQPTVTPVPEPTPIVLAARTAYPRVHLRRRPDLNAYSLTLLLAGEELEALGRSADGEWIRIRRGEYVGWSAAWTLELDGTAGQLPAVEAR